MVDFSENVAKQKGFKYIRLDCRNAYTEIVEYYKHRKFKVVGTLIDEEDNNETYSLMEKTITE